MSALAVRIERGTPERHTQGWWVAERKRKALRSLAMVSRRRGEVAMAERYDSLAEAAAAERDQLV